MSKDEAGIDRVWDQQGSIFPTERESSKSMVMTSRQDSEGGSVLVLFTCRQVQGIRTQVTVTVEDECWDLTRLMFP